MALSVRFALSFSSGSSARLQIEHAEIGNTYVEGCAFHEEFPYLSPVPFFLAVVEHDGNNEREMLASGLISPRTDLVLPHEGHVPEQLEGTGRGRVVLMLKDDVDASLFAVLCEAPKDDVRDGFL